MTRDEIAALLGDGPMMQEAIASATMGMDGPSVTGTTITIDAMVLPKILVAVHPETSPVKAGRMVCRKQILMNAYLEIKGILEEEGIIDADTTDD